MEIRRFRPEDAQETAQVVITTLRVSNSKDYPPEYIDYNVASHSPEVLLKRAEEGHMYVVCDGSRIVGCGAIAPYWGSETESILLTIFVLPEYQGKGVGRLIIETLEQDEYFLRADRIEIPASITGVEFYKKMGYGYKNGIEELEDGVMYRMEKFRGR
ncbi:MAG: GNAT family N-acetyltransferase [Ruminococcaceae bacterium]|nr:GNAT family N-acetyltransferase [Oscillospiraceae bacterium]